MAAPRKVVLVTAGVLLGVAGLLAVLAFLFPVYLTGGFCEIKIESIEFLPKEEVRISFRARIAVALRLETDTRMAIIAPWRIPARPYETQDQILFSLVSSGENLEGLSGSTELRRRVLVEEGKVYRLRTGDRLVYLRKPVPKRGAVEGAFVLKPD